MKNHLMVVFAVTVSFAFANLASADPMVWNNMDKLTFTKAAGADWNLPENQDRITDSVWITREDKQGIFNINTEADYKAFSSPEDTEWASGSATDWESLTFSDWETWHDSAPPTTVGMDAVVHLISDDIYIDIKFLSWQSGENPVGEGNTGGFSYERSTAPIPLPSALLLLGSGLLGLIGFRKRNH